MKQNMPPLAFTQKQFCLQSPCFLSSNQFHTHGRCVCVSNSLASSLCLNWVTQMVCLQISLAPVFLFFAQLVTHLVCLCIRQREIWSAEAFSIGPCPPGPKLELGRNQRNRAHHLFYSTVEPPPNANRGIKRTVLGVRDGSIHFSNYLRL